MKFDDSFFDKVYMLFEMGRTDAAMGLLDAVPKNHSEYPRALFYKSMFLKNEGDDGESFDLFKQAIEMEYANRLSSTNPDDIFEIAMEHYYEDEFEEAIKLFDSCIEKGYNVVDSLKFKSACLSNMELYGQANECIDEALEIDGENMDLFQSKGVYLGELGDYEESLKWIDKAIEIDPECPDNFNIKAITYFKMGNHQEALACLDKNPEDIDAIILKVKLYNELEDYENVEKCLEAAESIDADNLDFLFTASMYYLSRDDFENANGYIDRCLEIEPESDMFAQLKLAIVRQFDDSDMLDDALQDIYQSNPDLIEAILNDEMPARGSAPYADSGYALEDLRYGKDYPSQSMNYNIYNVLSGLKSDSNITDVYSSIEVKDSYSDEIITRILIENDYIEPLNLDDINVRKEAMARSPQELSRMLKEEGITASGKKKKLVKMAVKSIPAIKFCSSFAVTDKGEEFLGDYSWFEVYDKCLLPFDLNDVSKYIDDNDGKHMEILDDYIFEHIDRAHQREDFEYLDDCLISQSLFYLYQKDWDRCLRSSLSELILKFNPLYEYELSYARFTVIDPLIIENIRKCLEMSDADIESLFNEMWDLKDGETDYTSREEGFMYLKRALDGEDLDDLSDEYEEKYIKVIARD